MSKNKICPSLKKYVNAYKYNKLNATLKFLLSLYALLEILLVINIVTFSSRQAVMRQCSKISAKARAPSVKG